MTTKSQPNQSQIALKRFCRKIINNDQTGFLKNRTIGENITIIDSIIKYASTKQIPGLLLFIDFEKAFDSIEWPFIERTLKHFNFEASSVTWFKLFYSNISSCIQNNGWSYEFYSLSRGVRQGCPLSPISLFFARRSWPTPLGRMKIFAALI